MSYNFPKFDFSFEKHEVEIKKDFFAEVDWDIDIRGDVKLDVYKDIDVNVKSDVDLEGNVAIGRFDIEDLNKHNDLEGVQFAEITELGVSSLAQMEVETKDYTIAGIADASTSHFPAVTLAEFDMEALVTENHFHLTHVGESAVDFAF